MLPRLTANVRAWFARPRLEREMREEMEAHIEQATALLMARGLSREEAERQALREFGPVSRIQEEGRDARGALWIEATLADARYAFRQFRRRRGTVATIILVLGLGLGVNNTVFAVLHSFATMPPRGIDRDPSLVRVRIDGLLARTYDDIAEFTRLNDVFSDVVVSGQSTGTSMRTGGADDVRVEVTGMYVSSNHFQALGARPALGRFFEEEERLAEGPVPAVLGHQTWQTHFGGARDIIGRAVQVNDAFVTIVGVAAEGFSAAALNGGTDIPLVWMPLSARGAVDPRGADGYTSWSLVARIRPGVSRAKADAAVKVAWARSDAAERLQGRYSSTPPPDVAPLLSFNVTQSNHEGVVYGSAIAGLGSLLFLLVVCTNVSALMVGLAATRRREIAVRLSLGASRRRLIRQLLTESVLLAGAGGIIGMLFLVAALRILGRWIQSPEITLAWPVLIFTFALALGTGVLTGLSPALHATRMTVQDALKDAAAAVSHTRSRLHSGLISAQIALTQPLLVGLGATVLAAAAAAGGYGSSSLEERIATIRFASLGATTADDREALLARYNAEFEEVRQRIAGIPGVIDAVPHSAWNMLMQSPRVHPADQVAGGFGDGPIPVRTAKVISGGWLSVRGVPIIAGQDFERVWTAQSIDRAIIRSDLAERLWGNADPVGRRILVDDGKQELTVIGIVDERVARPLLGSDALLFVQPQSTFSTAIAFRTHAPAEPLFSTVRQIVGEASPNLSINRISLLAAERQATRSTILVLMGATGAGGMLALLLSAIGLYALVSLTVAERRRDIGVRGALGAGRLAIVRPFVARAVKLAVIGMILGLPISLIGARVLNEFAEQEVIHLPAVTALVAISVFAVVAVATLLPAARAVRMNPMDTLRDAA